MPISPIAENDKGQEILMEDELNFFIYYLYHTLGNIMSSTTSMLQPHQPISQPQQPLKIKSEIDKPIMNQRGYNGGYVKVAGRGLGDPVKGSTISKPLFILAPKSNFLNLSSEIFFKI